MKIRNGMIAGVVMVFAGCGSDTPDGPIGTLQTGALTFAGTLPAGTAQTVSARDGATLVRSNVAADGSFSLDLPGGTRYVLTVENLGRVTATFSFAVNRQGDRTNYLQVAGLTPAATALTEGDHVDLGAVETHDGDARPEHEPAETLDSDDDGVADIDDRDDDADGVTDDSDELFGNETTEGHDAVDEDADGVLNWNDSDIDGDGTPNETDTTPGNDAEENAEHPGYDANDLDHDGKLNVDEFGARDGFFGTRSLDSLENTFDTDIDGDGLANNSGDELDIDGDGVPDAEDLDIDGDGVLNACDADMDGDGKFNDMQTQNAFCATLATQFPGHVEQASSAYCTQATVDTDKDGDGVLGDVDSFPGAGSCGGAGGAATN